MKGVPAIYLGRIVQKEGFRTFVYAADLSKKLVESWDEYEKHMASGMWFATIDDVQSVIEKPRRGRKPAESKHEEGGGVVDSIVEIEHEEINHKKTFVDDFLPRQGK